MGEDTPEGNGASTTPPRATRSESPIRDLNASVRFTGTQFIITNEDKSDWKNVEMEINAGIVRGGYSLKHQVIKAWETYTGIKPIVVMVHP